jgi:3-ketoacyl-CoA synthase
MTESSDRNIFVFDPKSLRIRSINWYIVFSTHYKIYLVYASVILLALLSFRQYQDVSPLQIQVLREKPEPVLVLSLTCVFIAISLSFIFWSKPSVYLLDFTTFKPPPSWQVTHEDLGQIIDNVASFTPESRDFQKNLIAKSGTGPTTAWPPSTIRLKDGLPQDNSRDAHRAEAEAVIFGCVEELFRRNPHIRVRDIHFLIINCSLHCPTPSLCALVAHRFKMRSDIGTFNLGGMGCMSYP